MAFTTKKGFLGADKNIFLGADAGPYFSQLEIAV
jgi:hypothetical protein